MTPVVGFIVTVFNLPVALAADFTLAYFTSNNSGNLGYFSNAGAAYMALEDAKEEGLLGNNTIRILANIRGCRRTDSGGEAVEMIETEGINGFIGVGCSAALAMTGYLASYFNIPIIAQAAVNPILGDKETYDTLLRVLPPYNKLALAVIEIFKYYRWKKVFIVSRSRGLCFYAANGIYLRMSVNGLTLVDWLQYDGRILEDEEVARFLGTIKRKARIVYLCANTNDERLFMERAHEENMTSSDYVYITNTLRPFDAPYEHWKGDHVDYERSKMIKAAMRHKFTIALSTFNDVESFRERQRERMKQPPMNIPQPDKTSPYATTLYDSVYLYAMALNRSLERGADPNDGRAFIDTAKQLSFSGKSGKVAFDDNADRQPIYFVHAILEGDNDSIVWGVIDLTLPPGQRFIEDRNIWDTEDGLPPADSPPCGFFQELCPRTRAGPSTAVLIAVIIVSCLSCMLAVASATYYRKYRSRMAIELMKWKIAYNELDFMTGVKGVGSGVMTSTQRLRASAISLTQSVGSGNSGEFNVDQVFTKVAMFRGQLVAVKEMTKSRTNLTKTDLVEFKMIRELSHENVNAMVGACVDGPIACVVTPYCSRGSLQDILETDEITIDKSFKQSFILDIAKGLDYIHKSSLKSVGNVKSSNCVLDSRWTLKITDIPIDFLRPAIAADAGEHQNYNSKLWTPPELLRQGIRSVRGTQPGDIYSFSIVVHETIYRSLPYFMRDLTPKEIVEKLIMCEGQPYRPSCPPTKDVCPEFLQFLRHCWEEDPADRPTAAKILKMLPSFFDEQTSNLVDRVVKKLDSYATNLESIVNERTTELMQEKKRSDMLLALMLPVSVVEKLKFGHRVEPEFFEEATIYFSDVVDFDIIATRLPPLRVVNLLNDLYAMIDNVVSKHDAYKVETIGDSYVVASGLPLRNGHAHVAAIADMSLDILSANLKRCVLDDDNAEIHLRIGVHTGPCCAGVVGLSMPRYCIFGDTVNTASRMETNGLGSRIHLSEHAHTALGRYSGYRTRLRGQLVVKGKGRMNTFWLHGRADYSAPLPPECEGVDDQSPLTTGVES